MVGARLANLQPELYLGRPFEQHPTRLPSYRRLILSRNRVGQELHLSSNGRKAKEGERELNSHYRLVHELLTHLDR